LTSSYTLIWIEEKHFDHVLAFKKVHDKTEYQLRVRILAKQSNTTKYF